MFKKLKQAIKNQKQIFIAKHPRSKELFEAAKKNLLAGVPMNWMVRWSGAYPIFVEKAKGAHFSDVDGNDFVDLCLGDTGAMAGHAPHFSVKAIVEQASKGSTFMLPTENAIWVGNEMEKRFGLPLWQFTLSATDANRFALRIARAITQRKYILSFNYSYHGTVDETFASLNKTKTVPRNGNLGPQVDPSQTTKVIEFNDVDALEKILNTKQIACVLAEPAMTNIGIIHPIKGYHEALRKLTKKTGTFLIIDETHTICCGVGGYTKLHNLKPDILTIGKPIGGGIPAAAYGMTKEVAKKLEKIIKVNIADTCGIGGTLAGNALSIAAIKATLQNVLTEGNYKKTIELARYFTEGVMGVINEKKLPWVVNQLGCRAEYWFSKKTPLNGKEAYSYHNEELDYYMHLAALNRGVLLTPFHNMALICPDTSMDDINLHTKVFKESVEEIL